jgi:hypothetical protein
MTAKGATVMFAGLFSLTFLAATLHPSPSPTPFDASKIDYSQFSDEEIAKTAAHRDALKAKVKENVSKVTDVAVSQGSSITDIKKAADDAAKAFSDYQLAIESQITAGNKAIAALTHVLSQLHRAKWLACALWLGCVALLVTKLPLIAKPYAIYIAGGLFAAGSSAIWIWL